LAKLESVQVEVAVATRKEELVNASSVVNMEIPPENHLYQMAKGIPSRLINALDVQITQDEQGVFQVLASELLLDNALFEFLEG